MRATDLDVTAATECEVGVREGGSIRLPTVKLAVIVKYPAHGEIEIKSNDLGQTANAINGLRFTSCYAGAPSTVVSQWKVESASSRDLMLSFHRQLQAPRAAGKLTRAECLRRAALKLMKNPETYHPFYWAGFVLVGDNR